MHTAGIESIRSNKVDILRVVAQQDAWNAIVCEDRGGDRWKSEREGKKAGLTLQTIVSTQNAG